MELTDNYRLMMELSKSHASKQSLGGEETGTVYFGNPLRRER